MVVFITLFILPRERDSRVLQKKKNFSRKCTNGFIIRNINREKRFHVMASDEHV